MSTTPRGGRGGRGCTERGGRGFSHSYSPSLSASRGARSWNVGNRGGSAEGGSGGRGGRGWSRADSDDNWRVADNGRPKPPFDTSGRYGLVSKGDTTLLDHSRQAELYRDIVNRYNKLPINDPDFQKLSPLHTSSSSTNNSSKPAIRTQHVDAESAEIASILLSMRKLREGILGSARMDQFVKDVYMFTVRAAIALRHPESYLPAVIHLLDIVHVKVPLTVEERREFAGYYIFHLACLLEDYSEAFRIRRKFAVRDGAVDGVLMALVHHNYWAWAIWRKKVDLWKGKLMDFAGERIRDRQVRCIQMAYFTMEKEYLEDTMGIKWLEVKERHKLEWELGEDGKKVIVRKRKAIPADK